MVALLLKHMRRAFGRRSLGPRLVGAVIALALAWPCKAQQQLPSGVTSSRASASQNAVTPTPEGAATVGRGAHTAESRPIITTSVHEGFRPADVSGNLVPASDDGARQAGKIVLIAAGIAVLLVAAYYFFFSLDRHS